MGDGKGVEERNLGQRRYGEGRRGVADGRCEEGDVWERDVGIEEE